MNRTLLGFIQKELRQSFRDPAMKFILIISPIVQMFLFGVAISNEVKNIKLAAIFQNHDYVMEDIYQRSLVGGWFKPVQIEGNEDPFELVQSGKADAVLVAPPEGFTRALEHGNARMQILIDSTNVLQAQSVENYLTDIINNVIKDDVIAHGLANQTPAYPPHSLISGVSNPPPPDLPIKFDIRILYNPELETSLFLIPGVMCTLLVFTSLMLTMTAIVREKELGTFETLIAAPISTSEIIYGKTVPYVLVGMLDFVIVLTVSMLIFHVPLKGALWVMAVSGFVFVCTCVAMGVLISTFCNNQQQAALIGFWILFPAIMFSGLLFPLDNMPTIIQLIAYLDPLAHYLGLLRNIMLKGGGLHYVIMHTGILAFMCLVCVLISFRRFKTTLQ